MAAAVASPAPERVEFHRQPSAPAPRPRPPAWQRPAGAGPRPFLAKGGGKLSTSARPWAKVSRRMGSNGPSGVSPLTYDHRPADRPERWVAGRWKAAWEHPKVNTPAFRPRTAAAATVSSALAESSRVSLEEYSRFFTVQTGASPSRRVLDAFVASQALPVAEASGPPSPSPRSIRGVEGGPHWWEEYVQTHTRYKEESPRPPRDPSGVEPRTGGAGHAMFARSLRNYMPDDVRGYTAKSAYESAECLHRPGFVSCFVSSSAAGDCRSISDFGIWLTAEGEPLPDGVVPKNTSKSPYRNRT